MFHVTMSGPVQQRQDTDCQWQHSPKRSSYSGHSLHLLAASGSGVAAGPSAWPLQWADAAVADAAAAHNPPDLYGVVVDGAMDWS